MSYSQIFRRLNRILRGSINDIIDRFDGDDEDLRAFDAELDGRQKPGTGEPGGRGSNAGGSGGGETRSTGQGERSGQGGSPGSGSRGGGGQARAEGARRPGERDDAYYYGVLGLTPSASEADVKKTYRRLMSQVHPDRVATLSAEKQRVALARAQAINEAYHIIERRRGFK